MSLGLSSEPCWRSLGRAWSRESEEEPHSAVLRRRLRNLFYFGFGSKLLNTGEDVGAPGTDPCSVQRYGAGS